MLKILLVGNPNVGKSAIFSRLTGIRIIASNYPGTTVEIAKGYLKLGNEQAEVIDTPGIYSLEATSKAEQVAVEIIKQGDIIVNVVDATNLERNLNLTIQLLERQLPVIVALNMWDDARHKGVNIDVSRLEELIGVPVVPTVGITGQGIKELVSHMQVPLVPGTVFDIKEDRWTRVGAVVDEVQSLTHRHHTWRDMLEDISNHPVGGVFVAMIVLLGTFWFIRFVGEGIINYITDPIFEWLWTPLLLKLSSILGSGSFGHTVLIGNLLNGQVDYLQSFGLLSTGLYIPLAAVLPYILAFYLVLGLLEDSGYLPRLAVLMDTMLHKLGLHGYAIVPTILGLGCNVPAVMATRILESRRERFIAATLISIGVPCAALQAMIIGLVGQRGIQYVVLVYFSLFLSWVIIGLILNRVARGLSPELLVEIPSYRLPAWRIVGEKLWLRLSGFIKEAFPIVIGALLVIILLNIVGFFEILANITAPVVSGLLGLPKETVIALVIGVLRKDVAMGMLAPLALTAKQLVISSTVLAMSFPCVATFVILTRELGVKDMLKATLIMIIAALVVGSIQNLVL